MKCDKCGYSDNGSGDWAHVCGPVNIKAGADIHAGDGGYTEGTQEEYERFVKIRNQSLNKARIREFEKQSGLEIYGLGARREKWEATIDKFAKLVAMECVSVVENLSPGYDDYRNQIEDSFRSDCVDQIKQHFGVEE